MEIDHFSGYDPNNQLRPRINRADLFRTTGSDLGWFLLEPISIANSLDEEPALVRRFSKGQKAIYFWWYLDCQVCNGGFAQFYGNGYGIYVPAILKGLEHIGDKKMADLVTRAHSIYLDNKRITDLSGECEPFSDELYEQLGDFDGLDSEYYKLNNKTAFIIEKYAKQHPNEFCVDENGNELPENYSGKLAFYFENGKLHQEIELINGILHGELRVYFPSGQISTLNNFRDAQQIGEQSEWFENGNQRSVVTIDVDNAKKCKYYYENGNLKELVNFVTEYKRTGLWLQFWEDGRKKLEAEFKNEEVYFRNYWNAKGAQILIDGTGLYIHEYSIFEGEVERTEQEYQNYKRHGKQWSYRNDILTLYQEMENGKEHGLTRVYDAGKLTKEAIYDRGKEISSKIFDS